LSKVGTHTCGVLDVAMVVASVASVEAALVSVGAGLALLAPPILSQVKMLSPSASLHLCEQHCG